MKHKLLMKYSFISTLLIAVTLCLLRWPSDKVKADPPEPTPGPTIDDLAQQTLYATPGATMLNGCLSLNFGDTADIRAGCDEYPKPDGQNARSLVECDVASLLFDADISEATHNASQHQASSVSQSVVVINFDEASQPCDFSSTAALRNRYQAIGVTFDGPGGNNGGAILDECGNFRVSGHSSPNFLAFNASARLSDGGIPRDPETITFATTVSFVQVKAGSNADSGQALAMEAFDRSDKSLGSDTITLSPRLQPLSISARGITRVVISSSASIFVLDDLTFNTETGGLEEKKVYLPIILSGRATQPSTPTPIPTIMPTTTPPPPTSTPVPTPPTPTPCATVYIKNNCSCGLTITGMGPSIYVPANSSWIGTRNSGTYYVTITGNCIYSTYRTWRISCGINNITLSCYRK